MSYQIDICFFFQSEDGIRDGHVTGVQTCALPISDEAKDVRRLMEYDEYTAGGMMTTEPLIEIGRASCRERVDISVASVSLVGKTKAKQQNANSREHALEHAA